MTSQITNAAGVAQSTCDMLSNLYLQKCNIFAHMLRFQARCPCFAQNVLSMPGIKGRQAGGHTGEAVPVAAATEENIPLSDFPRCDLLVAFACMTDTCMRR